jgi:hypothetical protein
MSITAADRRPLERNSLQGFCSLLLSPSDRFQKSALAAVDKLLECAVTPTSPQPSFANEELARDFLEQLLIGWFYLKSEVWLSYPETVNRLRIDYLAKRRPDTDFPFEHVFGIECKRQNRHGGQAVKQAIDYTHCLISDNRVSLAEIRNKRLSRVYIFPAPSSDGEGWHGGVERLAGLFHVGLIYVRHAGYPQFCMSAERHWDPGQGPRAAPIHFRDLVGSGAPRRPAHDAGEK